MGRAKIKKKSTFIDMTAMSDVTVLLLTFFMLTSTFVKKEPVQVTTPASVSEIKIPETNILQILVDPDGKVFMSLDKQSDLREVLEAMGQEYGVTFTPEETKKFSLASTFGVPMKSMKKYLDLPQDQQDAVLKNEGIPTDSIDNQFKAWVRNARATNKDLRIAIKADANTPYSVIKNVMNSLQDLRENRYNLITSLKTTSEEKGNIMAEIQESGNKKKGGKNKQKKMTVRVDFTPMVDMNMLLITFFMLCTSLSKPQTMEISMPSNDKNVTEEQQSKVKASQAITLLLGGDNKLYYYDGEPNYKDYSSLKETTYQADGLRAMLLQRNRAAVNEVNELKQQKLDLKISEEEFTKKLGEIKSGKDTPTVIIKATDDASYMNLIDALDEMQICNIGKYVITDIAEADEFLIKNYDSKGELSQNIAE